jgi:fatty-acyl-CoA synthase
MMKTELTLIPTLERAGTIFRNVEIVSRLPDKSLHRTNYGEFYRRARALAEMLERLGLQHGERVGTLMWNHYAHHEAYFGIPASGGVLHTLNLRLSPDDIAYIVNHAGDRFVIIDDVLLPLWERVRPNVHVEKVFVVPLTGKPVPEGYESYEALLAKATGHFEYPVIREDDPLGMCYTSGTTGRPKGVVYSHRSIVLHSLASVMPDVFALSQADTMVPVVPMFHVNAWGIPFSATMTGTKQVFPGPHLDATSLLDLFEREKVTCSAGVPTIWLGIAQALEANPTGWKLTPGLRMIVGGAAAPESLIRRLDKHGLTVIHAWGMTETAPLGSVSRIKTTLADLTDDQKYAIRAKQGLQGALVEVRIVGENGIAAWDGHAMGELQVRGPHIASGYYNSPDPATNWTEDGWFKTGDIATIDSEGYIAIVDRSKDVIKSGGEWISSVDLENAIMGHPAVVEAAVIAIPHEKWQERPLACVVLKAGQTVTAAEIIEFLRPKFAKFWLPDDVVFIEAVPKTSTGKFQKMALRERFKDHLQIISDSSGD